MDELKFEKNIFRNRLEQAMAKRHVRAVDLGKKAGLSEQLISQYRSGRSAPKREKLIALSRALDVSPVWLMGYDVPMETELKDQAVYLNDEEAEIITRYKMAGDLEKEMVKRILKYTDYVNTGRWEN